jgi:hypothetical protein
MNGVDACLIFTAVLFTLISIPIIIIPLSNYLYVNPEKCFINSVIIPTTPPYEDSNGWINCDCGRRCESFKPCIKIYTNMTEEKYIIENVYNYDSLCTFYDSENCENTIDFRNYLNQSNQIYNQYINQTVDCFHGDNLFRGLYLEHSVNIGPIIVLSLIIFILLIILFCRNYQDMKTYFKSKIYLVFKCDCLLDKNNNIINNNSTIKNPIFEPLQEIVVDNLPSIKLSKKQKKELCVICLKKLDNNSVKLSCNHILHRECWLEWKKINSSCPTCRNVE